MTLYFVLPTKQTLEVITLISSAKTKIVFLNTLTMTTYSTRLKISALNAPKNLKILVNTIHKVTPSCLASVLKVKIFLQNFITYGLLERQWSHPNP